MRPVLKEEERKRSRKVNLKWIVDLSLKPEASRRKQINFNVLGQQELAGTPQHKTYRQEAAGETVLLQMLSAGQKKWISRTQSPAQESLGICTPDRGLTCRIYNRRPCMKETILSINKRADSKHEEMQIANNYSPTCSTSLVVRAMQTNDIF